MKTSSVDEQRRERRGEDFGMSSVLSQVMHNQFQMTLAQFKQAELSPESPLKTLMRANVGRVSEAAPLNENPANLSTRPMVALDLSHLRGAGALSGTATHEAGASDGLASLQLQSAVPAFSSGARGEFQDVVQEASQKYGVPVSLINAVIKQESAFNPKAESHCGAQGLMQLMPATAKAYGCADSFDARQNVMAGTRFLGDLLSMYKGDVELALAGYNAGPGNVAKYGGQVPPFAETKNYVAKVQGYYQENRVAMDRGTAKFAKS